MENTTRGEKRKGSDKTLGLVENRGGVFTTIIGKITNERGHDNITRITK
jgi:hypothetical protein